MTYACETTDLFSRVASIYCKKTACKLPPYVCKVHVRKLKAILATTLGVLWILFNTVIIVWLFNVVISLTNTSRKQRK